MTVDTVLRTPSDAIIQIFKFTNLFLNIDKELLDTLQGQLVLLDKDLDGISHELLSDLQYVTGHGRRQQDSLRRTQSNHRYWTLRL